MISLGCYDATVGADACSVYLGDLESITRKRLRDISSGPDKISLTQYQPVPGAMTVAAVQQALKTVGFFPGGKVDGICGYRTHSAIRVFQEYVRSVEKQPDCLPDGRFGPKTQQHLQRWLAAGIRAAWLNPTPKQTAEYDQWLSLLSRLKAQYMAHPTAAHQLVNSYQAKSDTRKPAEWDFSGPGNTHLIGIRRSEDGGKFDDLLILLIKGLVFKFQGSTKPGQAADPRKGLPFLLNGQHLYHFGWHKSTYLALRPQQFGVLVVRSKNDKRLDSSELRLDNTERNDSINIHWGGMGLGRPVNNWSEGCQVINSSVYFNPDNEVVDCRAFAAANNHEVATNPKKTRAAYNVITDLVIAFASDIPGNTVRYTLISEQDLRQDPELDRCLANAVDKVARYS
jgi:peptidoglycan hydrolase-like protein with peptidoglycan-binding domain